MLTAANSNISYTFTYDILYRLLQATPVTLKEEGEEKELKPETYSYDPLGNRLTSAKDAYAYNNANQLLNTKRYTCQYDQNGNLIKKTETDEGNEPKTTTYTYDFENRLTQVLIQEDDEAKIVSFKYDPLGRRIEKRVTEQEDGKTESKTITYVYDNEDIILEYHIKQEDNQTKEETIRYTHGPGIDEPISIEQDNQIYHYHYDGLGSVTSLSDSTGKTIQSYTYDSFGNLERHGNKTKNRFTYTGREYDKETGLYYYRNRYYDPKIGRFLTQDPIGMIDGPNLYTYAHNNPVNWLDPYGLDKQKKEVPWWQPMPERALRWSGRILQEAGYKISGRTLSMIGVALEPGGMGKGIGIIAGGTTGAIGGKIFGAWVGSLIAPGTGTVVGSRIGGVVGGIGGGIVGGWIGSYFDYPGAGQLNYNE